MLSSPPSGEPWRGKSGPPGARDPWIRGVFALNGLHIALFAWLYPNQRLDPDLIAYLTYFRNWTADERSLHGIAYFTHPKALLVFALGPLADPWLALVVSSLASAALGAIVYVIARDHFGRATALIASLLLLADPSKALLTLRSSADLYVAVFLFAAVLLADRKQLVAASVCVLLSALVKPVTLPCAAYFLVAEGTGRRRWLATLIPAVAVPLTALSNQALLGSAHGTEHFFEEFAALRGGDGIGPGNVFHFALWTQLVQNRFAATAAWGVAGMALWLGDDKRRLTSPLVLMPLLFLVGYFLLSFTSHFMPFFRFFWVLEVWFLMFLVYGALEGAHRMAPGHRVARTVVAAAVLFLALDRFIVRQVDYRRDFALPFERSMAFARAAAEVLRARGAATDRIVVPLALLPFTMWNFPASGRSHAIEISERLALDQRMPAVDWILDVPLLYASDTARRWMPIAIASGRYQVQLRDGEAALLAPDRGAAGASPDGAPRPP